MARKTAPEMAPPETLLEAVTYFADPDRALAFMVEIRWPNGVACPTCGSKEVSFLSTRRLWKCKGKHPKRQFSIKVGTIMEDSPIGIDKWLPAMWLIANCKNGISSMELKRALKVTQKTAWFMLHRIRLAMQSGTFQKLGGVGGRPVEVDECYIGGRVDKMNWKQYRRAVERGVTLTGIGGKAIVMGMLERGGRIALKLVQSNDRPTLLGHIVEHVHRGSEVHTDEHKAYQGLAWPDYAHEIVNHTETYVRGHVHTNGLESFWSLLKRTIRGTYVSVEPFHLGRYLDEQAFRFNQRKGTDRSRFVQTLRSIVGRRLTYAELVDASGAYCLP
jgi:hypothetical protein